MGFSGLMGWRRDPFGRNWRRRG